MIRRLSAWADRRRERQHFPETLPDQWLNLVDWVRYLVGEALAPLRRWRRRAP